MPHQLENIRKLQHQRYIDKKVNMPLLNSCGINDGGKSYDDVNNYNPFNPFNPPGMKENNIYTNGENSRDIVKNIPINNSPHNAPQEPPKPPNYKKKTLWKRNTCLVVDDSTLNGLQEDKMSANQMIKVREYHYRKN